MNTTKTFTEDEIKKLEPAEKIGLIATVNSEGAPHISLITSIQPLGADKLVFGEFSYGLSKWHVRNNPKSAFLMMTMDKSLWRGKSLWKERKKEGPEYIMYNEKPMFRYNTYFGINTVHYLDMIECGGKESLPLIKIILSVLLTRLSGKVKKKTSVDPLSNLSISFFNRMDSLKFLAYVGDDGYPEIIPVIQCRAASSESIVFSPAAYSDEMKKIPEGAEVAVFAMTLDMESVLVRGNFQGYKRSNFVNRGTVEIDWVYNSMPPVHGQIYPPVPLNPVDEF
ncbi:MAG TPA: pyridoxamine 5'-phosphate oxidase family protein [Spirochaetota bacterium]|nr:pyridoxamine 5'-phosphate oxidase family protein [Spirochaetota bacterium]